MTGSDRPEGGPTNERAGSARPDRREGRDASGEAASEARQQPTPETSFRTGTSRVGWALTLAFGALAVGPLVLAGPAVLVGVAGLLGVLAGLARESDRLVGLGSGLLVAGALVAGVYGLTVEPLLVATVGALLTYDVAENARSVGDHLGRAAPTASLELVHAAASTCVLALGGALAYGVFSLVGGGQPVLALVLLVVGAVTLSAALK